MCSKQPTVPEPELYRSVQAVLPTKTATHPGLNCDNQGMLRWILHKKVQNNPISSLSLVWVVVKELEKAERWDSRSDIIPLLHTLMYAIYQTAYLPDELYKRIYEFCKKLLTFPHPYCSVGLSYTKKIKTEHFTPGLMYQRMITAEQGLNNVHYPFRERVFVLADLEVFSESLMHVLLDDLNAHTTASIGYLSPLDHMRNIVLHSIQAALGPEQCNGLKLAQALKDMAQDIEPFYQEVMGMLERSAAGGCKGETATLRGRLHQLYNKIVTDTESEPLCGGALSDCPLPNPEMSVHLWTEDLDIWRELAKWLHPSSFSEEEDFMLGESPTNQIPSDLTRYSVTSIDSGIERDIPPCSDPSPSPTSALDTPSMCASWEENKTEEVSKRLLRCGGIKLKPSVQHSMVLMQDSFRDQVYQGGSGGRREIPLQRRTGSGVMQITSKQQRYFTAKIVAVGDDRVLGKLAKAYYFLRKKEARRLCLTLKVNLQFYYIPVCSSPSHIPSVKENVDLCEKVPCTVGSYLSIVDPWYNCNIKSLGAMIPKLAKQQVTPGRQTDPFISDIISYYVRCGQQPVFFTIYSAKITFTNTTKGTAEDVFLTHLEVDFPEFRQISATDKQKRSVGEIGGAALSINYKRVTFGCRDPDRGFSVRTSGLQIHAVPVSDTEDLNCLTLILNETNAKTKTSFVESKILTTNINIRSYEGRPFTVTLDRDSRQIYKNVLSIEISPCMDPGYCLQKAMRTKLNLHSNESGLSKYMSQGLQLPINTFSGIIS
ncbi:phosphoinositide 3-kinase regulatory subunit 6 isoform X2 [Gouania willdenowi]|uniref:phosphoinositide 3-kinase regulatory subunit 6 isoform X2 n=1 Tax=Gouania willdenowi TaxID=441366 RepID=UPI001056A9A4|nr:phosphoinositide 3-kinase regulatory subunit 6 isoform X2 [Gouania willdenowi]